MLLAAGPGSGKTFTIIERIRYLIEYYKVTPSEILVITFTKAAAAQMEQRFLEAVKEKSYPVCFGTFHAVFFHILKQAYHYNSNNIITEKEKKQYAKHVLDEVHIEADESLLEQLLNEFGKVKNSPRGIESYYFGGGFMEPEDFGNVYKHYREICIQNRKMDFDDMALQCLELFRRRKDILKHWQERFTFILMDEFQDINYAQYKVVCLLMGNRQNVFAVGDDDQSIYGFRGANPAIMQKFLRDFPNAEHVVLNRNYRSGRTIIEFAMQIIEENENRLPKVIEAGTKKAGEVLLHNFPSREEEYDSILQKLKEYEQNGQLTDCAVIFRTNQGCVEMKRRLRGTGIPFQENEKTDSIYGHFIRKDMEDYMRFAAGERTRERFLRIVNKPSRFIGRDSLAEGNVDFERIKQYYKNSRERIEAIEKLERDMEILKEMPPFLAINYIRKAIGYDKYLKECMAKGNGRAMENLFETAEKIQKEASSYRSLEEWIEAGKMVKDTKGQSNKEGVNVLTMHGAKGLEYETVFLPDINEGNVPYGKFLTKEEEEEERRIFYVAVTRAKSRLEIFYVENKKDKASRFLPKT